MFAKESHENITSKSGFLHFSASTPPPSHQGNSYFTSMKSGQECSVRLLDPLSAAEKWFRRLDGRTKLSQSQVVFRLVDEDDFEICNTSDWPQPLKCPLISINIDQGTRIHTVIGPVARHPCVAESDRLLPCVP